MAEGESTKMSDLGVEQRLRTGYTRLKMENAQLQTKVGELQARIGELDTAVKTAQGEVTSARDKYDQNKLKTENQELRGQLRTYAHRRVFDRLAAERGAATDALDLVWNASGWKPEKDDVDEAAMGELLDTIKARPGVARLFGGGESEPPPKERAAGSGQGGKAGNGMFRVTSAQLSSDEFMYENQARVMEARRNGTLEVVG